MIAIVTLKNSRFAVKVQGSYYTLTYEGLADYEVFKLMAHYEIYDKQVSAGLRRLVVEGIEEVTFESIGNDESRDEFYKAIGSADISLGK